MMKSFWLKLNKPYFQFAERFIFFFLSAALPARDELLPARRSQEPSAAAEHGGAAATATGRQPTASSNRAATDSWRHSAQKIRCVSTIYSTFQCQCTWNKNENRWPTTSLLVVRGSYYKECFKAWNLRPKYPKFPGSNPRTSTTYVPKYNNF